MGRIHLVNTCYVSKSVVESILIKQPAVISVSFKFQNDKVILMAVGTWNGNIFIFDLKQHGEMMHDGQLWRLLQSNDLTKVIHDCRAASVALKRHFSVTMRNVFDTQASYCVKMMEKKLPPRCIPIQALYEKFGDPAQRNAPALKAEVDQVEFVWEKRPMHREMITLLAGEVSALVPAIYENMTSNLEEETSENIYKLSSAYINGHFKRSRGQQLTDVSQEKLSAAQFKPIIKLSPDQVHLLKDTVPSSTPW